MGCRWCVSVLVEFLRTCAISKLARVRLMRYDKAMSNAHTTEIPFLEAIASMTDAELASYKARYAKANDSISRIHDHAVRAEIARRAK